MRKRLLLLLNKTVNGKPEICSMLTETQGFCDCN
jgi:hypothetical protein